MPVSAVIDRQNELKVASLDVLLADYVLRWKLASTLEERLTIEGHLLGWFDYLLSERWEIEDVREGDSPLVQDFRRSYDLYHDLHQINRVQLQELADRFVQYFNSRQISLLELQGKLRRIRQKRAALALWDIDAIYVLAERF